ncbi:uncharacterized protein LOC126846884 [Adelges cooleyi]|uniref:uncharacterized protein LOC126846884 n=1 Tax=Adelges cooleyi TaxID=133065 RepID=UPI00217FF38C|nr:uncharacterized protein LOC126846884 [Adelges cooleyi]
MFFKFSILLLYFIIIAYCVQGEPEDENETLKDSFDNCRRWLGKSQSMTIKINGFLLYLGKNITDLNIIRNYFKNNPATREKQASIDLSVYGELFKHICKTRDVSVKTWALYMKVKAAIRTLEEAILLDWGDYD